MFYQTENIISYCLNYLSKIHRNIKKFNLISFKLRLDDQILNIMVFSFDYRYKLHLIVQLNLISLIFF